MFHAIVVLVCFVSMMALEVSMGVPSEPLVVSLIEALSKMAGFLLGIGATHTLIQVLKEASNLGTRTERRHAVAQGFLRLLLRCTFFLLSAVAAGWFLSHYGDTAVAWWQKDPTQVVTYLAAVVVITALGFFAGFFDDMRFFGGAKQASPVMGSLASTAQATVHLSDRDVSVAAAHEAGHALLHAALVPVPTDIKISLGSSNGTHGVLAFVTAGTRENRLPSKEFAHWEMLTYLAGTVAESFAFKQQSMGATGDHRQWINVAIQYLSCFGEEVFVGDASTDAEIKYNRAILRELREAHIHELADFFLVNREVFHELRERLMTQHKLVHEEIKDLFDRVIFPEGFPRPSLSASSVEIK